MKDPNANPLIAIACGGTGGHLFPGIAIGTELLRLGCDVTLLISPKEVDQWAVRGLAGFQIEVLPAVALERGRLFAFGRGCRDSFLRARRLFQQRRPAAVLAMGGFTAAPPMLAGRLCGAALFLHESNAIPGRANRLLARWVRRAFVGFREAGDRLRTSRVTVSGTPVREQFCGVIAATCRRVLGLAPERPTLLVMGGSQGAGGVNELVRRCLPELLAAHRDLQLLWITGGRDAESVKTFCRDHRFPAVVRTFVPEMEVAYGAATVAVSRAGAGTLAELAAMRVPAILIPFPKAADDHQYHNALAFEKTGAARLLREPTATPRKLAAWIGGLLTSEPTREAMRRALTQWHVPAAAAEIARAICAAVPRPMRTASGNESGRVRAGQSDPVGRASTGWKHRGVDALIS